MKKFKITFFLCVGIVFLALLSPLATRQVCGESASFGYMSIGSGSGVVSYLGVHTITGSSFVCSANGWATNITVALRSVPYTSALVQCAIYSEESSPNLLAVTPAAWVYTDSAFVWYTFNFAYPYVEVANETVYLLVVWVWDYEEADWIYAACDNGASAQGHVLNYTYGDFPDPLSSLVNDYEYSIYCTLETVEPPPPSESEWENVVNTGAWLVDERTNVVVENMYWGSSGTLEFQKELTVDFYGWEGNLTVNSFSPDREWWEFNQEKYCNFTFAIHGDDADDVVVTILFQEKVWLWGALQGLPQVWGNVNGSTSLGGMYPLDEQGADPNPYPDGAVSGFRVVRDGSGLQVEVYAYLTADLARGNFLIASGSFTRATEWFANVTLTQYVEHWGKGHFNITLTDSIHESVWYPDPSGASIPHYPDIFDLISGAVYNVLPSGARVWIDSINAWIGGLWALVIPFWGMCLVLIPLVPVVLVVYFLDVAKTSVDEGSFTPIGEFAATVFSVASSVIGTLIGAVHAVWDILHFW